LGGAAALDLAAGAGDEATIGPAQATGRFGVVLPGAGDADFARPAGLPGAQRVHTATDRAFAHFGAEGTERWTALGPDPAGHRWDDIRRHQRPMRLGNRWDSPDDTLSLLAEPMANAPGADALDPLGTLFTQLGR
jgi:hypothetical protein